MGKTPLTPIRSGDRENESKDMSEERTSVKNLIDEKTLRKMKKNNLSFKVYLKKYNVTFSKDLDELWVAVDYDKNGFLDEEESLQFLIEVAKVI